MGSDWEPHLGEALSPEEEQFLQRKSNHILLKLFVAALLMGLSFRLFYPRSPAFSPVAEPPTVATASESHKEKCDLFSGQWIRDPSGPAYTNTSCPFIEGPQNCMKNGRPDTDYHYWRWKPHGCDVPPLDSKKFLEAMRGKTFAFIGDSILRNHGQSMVCLLSKAEMAVELYHDEDYKSRSWLFLSYNYYSFRRTIQL